MAATTLTLGIVLALLGVGAYFGTGAQSVTALIPTFFGVPFVILGLLARDERKVKATMHVAAVLALVGLMGSARGIPGVIALLGGGEVARPAAAVVQALMAGLCLVFLILAVRSFVQARRSRPS